MFDGFCEGGGEEVFTVDINVERKKMDNRKMLDFANRNNKIKYNLIRLMI